MNRNIPSAESGTSAAIQILLVVTNRMTNTTRSRTRLTQRILPPVSRRVQKKLD
jgi:hypothetical protein